MEIELTESTVMENLERVQEELAQLNALGTTLTLDDFGTGYSSLVYLKQLHLDKLKIDQTFVQGLPRSVLDASISRAIIALGRDLGLRVSAEGVETSSQAAFLRALGCDELQGYFLGKPAPASAAEAYFVLVDRDRLARRVPAPVSCRHEYP